MDNYKQMQSMLNPGANQYFSGYIPPLSPEAYQNQMYQQNELPLQAPMPNAGYPEQEPKNMMPQPAPAAVMPAPLAPPQYQSVPSSALAEQMKPKQKRRSKNERNGRDYICGCGKTYLSYPALYTHIKTKHGGQNPCGTQQLQTGRGRGRPRKPNSMFMGQTAAGQPGPEAMHGAGEGNRELRPGEVPSPEEALRKYGVLEDNSTPILNMCDSFLAQAKTDSIQLYTEILDELKVLMKREEDVKVPQIEQKPKVQAEPQTVPPAANRLPEMKKEEEGKKPEAEAKSSVQPVFAPALMPALAEKMALAQAAPVVKPKNCHVILAEYLYEMSKKVNEKFFMTLIIFTRLYRDYMNIHGWDIVSRYKAVSKEERDTSYAKCSDAEHMPEACNDFAKNYLPKEHPSFDQEIAIDITLHLCQWLYRKGYTHTHISRL